MNRTMWMAALSSVAFSLCAQQADQNTPSTAEDDIIEQATLIVSEQVPNIPAPLQSEARNVQDWVGGASLTLDDVWTNQRAANVKDIVDFIPGIYAQQRNGAESARIAIRGSGLGRQFQGGGLLLLQDGVPLNTADGAFDFQAIDPWLTDYVTAYRGGNGMALGGSTLGGVINLGTTLPDVSEGNELRLAAGSFDTQRAMVGWTTGHSTKTMRVRATHFNQDGFRVQNQQRSNRIDWQFLLKDHNNTRHKLGLFHLNTQAELPSSLSQALIDENPRQSRGFNIFGNFNRDLHLTRFSYQFQNPDLTATFFVTTRELDNPVFTYINRDSDDVGFNLRWQRGAHLMLLNTQWGDQTELRRENEGGSPGADRLRREQQAQTVTATYLYQQPWLNEAWSFEVGAQAVYAQRDINETWPGRITSNRAYSQLSPRLAISYQPQANLHWYSSLSRSFEAPTFAELNNGNQPGINTPIGAQKATTLELGSKGFIAALKWDLSVYYSQIDDEFIRFRFPDGATRTTNADDSVHFGLESAIQWQMATGLLTASDQLSMTTAYQWSQFKLDGDVTYGNNHIPGMPEHYLQNRLEYRPNARWLIAPSIEWVPSGYYIDLANSVKTNNYLLTGLNISYTHPRGWQWYVDAKNLNDQTYISTSLPIPDAGGNDGNYFYSGEGRAVFTGVRWSF